MCSETVTKMPYLVKGLYRRDFRFFTRHCTLRLVILKHLFFNEPMKKMTSLAGLFLTRRSSVSLKNLFSAVRLAFNVFRFGLRIQWMTLHVFL